MIEFLKEHWSVILLAVAYLAGVLTGWSHVGVGKLIEMYADRLRDEERCTTCKEYDQKNHCCHRWTDCIRRTIDELKDYYAFHSIKEKPDEDGKYLVQYDGCNSLVTIALFDAEHNAFGEWFDGYYKPTRKGEGKFYPLEEGIVAWARLPERYEGDSE